MEQSIVTTPPTIAHPRHKVFADSYLAGNTKTQAALEAGYAKGSASVRGAELSKRPDVAAYIEFHRQQSTEEAKSRRELILEELSNVAFSNIADFTRIDAEGNLQIDFTAATREQLGAVRSFKSKERKIYDRTGKHVETEKHAEFTLWDKLRAAELLGREEGLFKEAEHRVVIDVADRLLAARRRVMATALPAPDATADGEE